MKMRINGWLHRQLLNGYFRIKGMGVFALVPIFVLYVLIPLTNYAVFRYFQDMDMLYSNIIEICRCMVPACSVWHVLFILYHFVEEPGNEVLYLSARDKLADLVLPYILYTVLLLPLFFVYTGMFPELWFFYVKLCAVDLACLAFSYCLAFLFGSISVSAIGILVYSIGGMMVQGNRNDVFIYKEAEQDIGGYMLSEVLPYIAAAIVLCLLGKLMNRYLLKYK